MVFSSTIFRNQSGSTMASVIQLLIIIGLLVGTFLMGGEIKNNASTIMVIKRINAYDSAVRSFANSYAALPGDIRNPKDRLVNCIALPCSAPGNGNQIIADRKPLISTPFYFRDTSENRTFWLHLAVAGFVKDVKADGTKSKYFGQWGIEFPKAPLGVKGGFHIAYYSVTSTPFNPMSLLGHYMVLRGTTDTYGINVAPYVMVPKIAELVDNKIDDGKPQTGRIIAAGSNNCATEVNAYNPEASAKECNLLFQLSF